MRYKNLYFSGHATLQMFKRRIEVENIEKILKTGKVIKEYPEDKPYASFLILGFIDNRPIHIVASLDDHKNCYIITAYEPDIKLWNENFTTKK